MYGTDLKRGFVLSTAAAVFAAGFLVPYKKASTLAEAEVVAFVLLVASALWNTALALWKHGFRWRIDRVSLGVIIALAGFSIAGNFCNAQALLSLEPAVDAVVLRTQVVFVAIAGALFLGEAIHGRLMLGAALTLVGLVVMQNPMASDADWHGVLWALGAANSFGAMVLVTRKYITRIELVPVNAMRLWLGAAVLLAVPGVARGAIAESSGELWMLATIAAFCGPFVSRLFIMYALKHVTAAFQVLVSLSSPVFALLLGALVLRTVPTGIELLGGGIMLVGIAIPVTHGLRRSG